MQIVICDDHPVVREGLKRILTERLECSVIVSDNGHMLLQLVGREQCDLVVLDLTLPGRGGLDVLCELKQKHPRIPVLVLSIHSAEQYAVRALRAGASGYLTKNLAPEELVNAVRAVATGHRYLTPDVAERLAEALERPPTPASIDLLSDREFEVLGLLASGKTIKQVAEQLCLSYNTISTYRGRILSKLSLTSNADLVKYAMRHGLSE